MAKIILQEEKQEPRGERTSTRDLRGEIPTKLAEDRGWRRVARAVFHAEKERNGSGILWGG